MAALIYRNLKLYFRNRMGAMMSLLGALITFFIYISFLKENLVQEWQKVANANQVLDAWMMGGILTIAGVTTAFGALGQLVSDREDNRYQDFRMTALKQWQLAISYFISAFLISLIMQLVSFIIMAVYFKVTDNLTIKWADGVSSCWFHYWARLSRPSFARLLSSLSTVTSSLTERRP